MTLSRKLLLDAAERVAWTAIEAAGGAALDVLQSGHVTWRTVAYAALLAALKAIAASRFGNKNSAATLPSESAEPPVKRKPSRKAAAK